MSTELPIICLVRHGETAWSRAGKHTGMTDIPLNERGERAARALAPRLREPAFDLVLSSPLKRAARTCELAGFAAAARMDSDLCEWDYGAYEGRRTAEIRAERPDWALFRDGCPHGESAADVGARADRILARARAAEGNVLLFSSGHFLRVLAARWVHLPPEAGRLLLLGTGSVSVLAYDHNAHEPVLGLWNDTHHMSE